MPDGSLKCRGTAEGHAFDRDEFDALLELAGKGINEILLVQAAAIESAG